jgi:hypothetical protein
MPVPATKDFSVKFGRDPYFGLEKQKAFPFIYTLVNHNDDTWAPVAAGQTSSLSCLGPTIPASSTRNHNVVLDPDYNFKLIAIRYSCYKITDDVPPQFWWYTLISALCSDGMDQDMDWVGTPLVKYVDMTVSFQGCNNSAYLYGGPDCGPIYAGARVPLPLDVVEGYEYGFLTTRTPYLLPRQGVMTFEITNRWTADVVVAAAIYGMKIRV